MSRAAPPRRNTPGARSTAGFLLTETLATFTISAFILVGLMTASSVLLSAADRNVAHLQDVDALGRTLAAITRDVSSLSRARWNGKEPQPFVFRGGPNSLFFAVRDHATGAAVVVALREIVADHGTRLTRGEAKLTARMTGFGNLHFGAQRELDTGPTRLRYTYMRAAADGRETRVKDWPIGLQLPNALIVEAVAPETGRVILLSRIPIRANADIGCLGSDGGGSGADAAGNPAAAAAAAAGGTPVTPAPPTTPLTPQAPPAPGAPGATPADPADAAFCGRPDKDDSGQKPQATAALTP